MKINLTNRFTIKLLIIIALVSAMFTGGVSQIGTVLAVNNDSLKQQLLDKIFSQKNETIATVSDHIKGNLDRKGAKILDESEVPLTAEEQKQVAESDNKILEEHTSISDKHTSLSDTNCRGGDVLAGASNKKDLKILSECEEAIGTVKHTKKANDGDYKFALKVKDKFKFLLNKVNKKKTGGYLIVEIVPNDQGIKDVYLPKKGDKVDVWGAWVTDKPQGWHEIHPAWKVVRLK